MIYDYSKAETTKKPNPLYPILLSVYGRGLSPLSAFAITDFETQGYLSSVQSIPQTSCKSVIREALMESRAAVYLRSDRSNG